MQNKFLLLPLVFIGSIGVASASTHGYYVSAKVFSAQHKADNMESSARPGIGSFVKGDDRHRSTGGSIALGYDFAPNWRVEGEYTFPKNDEFTSGSTTFPSSFNHHKIKSQRVMANVYKDFQFHEQLSAYTAASLGLAQLKSNGWQGVASRQYGSSTDTNLSYSLGAGLSYTPISQVAVDLGYRYVDLGKTESGWNNFANARGLQDEQMKAKLISNEFSLGVRYHF